MTDDIPAAELDAILDQLENAGLVERYTNESGHEAYRLTAKGEPAARALAMAGDGGEAVLDALLEPTEDR